jgi:hypothetical protein
MAVIEELAAAGEGRARRLLDPGAGRVEQPHDGLAVAHRQLAYARRFEGLADRAHRAGHHGEVVGDRPDLAAFDHAVPGDDPVSGGLLRCVDLIAPHRLLVGEQAELDEGSGVEEEIDALPGGQLPSLMLPGDLLRTAHGQVPALPLAKLADLLLVFAGGLGGSTRTVSGHRPNSNFGAPYRP